MVQLRGHLSLTAVTVTAQRRTSRQLAPQEWKHVSLKEYLWASPPRSSNRSDASCAWRLAVGPVRRQEELAVRGFEQTRGVCAGQRVPGDLANGSLAW